MTMHNPPHPGEILKIVYLEPLGLTVTDAAEGLRVTRKTLSALINGHAGVSSEMALKLAKAFNTMPESWLNLQQQYNLWNAGEEVDTSHVRVFSWPSQSQEGHRI